MGNLTEQIDRQVKTGSALVTNARAKLAPVDSPRNRIAAGLMLGALAVGAAMMIIYSRRRRQTLADRLQKAIPGSVREFPDELVAQLKRPIERAVRAL
jgi:sensor c-di-GMP phosphodiesterase-like protein